MRTNEQILARMTDDMELRGYAAATRKLYFLYARLFLNWANKTKEALGEEDIRAFLKYLIEEKGLSVSTVNSHNAALRFLFAVTLDRSLNYRQVPMLKRVRGLPEILTKREIANILGHTSSLRDKAILMTIYGAGLRISELCNLKVRDIGSESMRIFVRYGKRGKDRYTLLSQSNLDILREYWKAYRPNHPDEWLFLNRDGSDKIHSRTVTNIFNLTMKRTGISKGATTHTLRACFATHLLEAGVDIYRIMQLLGHASIRTTTFYLRLTKFDPSLQSPLDSLPDNPDRKTKAVSTIA